MIRALVVLALVLAPIVLSNKMAGHHAPSGNIFQDLYTHVLPAPLETHGDGHHAEDSHGGAHTEDHGGEHAADDHGGGHGHGTVITVPAPGLPEFFTQTAHQQFHGELPVFNLQIFQIFAVLILLVCFSGVAKTIRTGQGDYISRLFAGFVVWIRDEMVGALMGREEGKQFLPFFLTLCFFILFLNLLGLIPGGATATANIGVTAALASVTLVAMLVMGMVSQGPIHFWTGLVPHGLPILLWPLMFLIEVVGLFVKPVALTIRLFANLTAGHLIVLSGMGLIYYFGEQSPVIGWVSAPLAVGFAVFIMIIESFVALLQAYIFTYLSILFVQMCVHPEH